MASLCICLMCSIVFEWALSLSSSDIWPLQAHRTNNGGEHET